MLCKATFNIMCFEAYMWAYALKMQIKHDNFHSKIQSQITATIS